jgi:FkbM family methyltransferase
MMSIKWWFCVGFLFLNFFACCTVLSFRYFYIDLGANDGSSVESFVGVPGRRNVAIDGSGKAPGLSDLTGIMNETSQTNMSVARTATAVWNVIAFEGNPLFNQKLEAKRANLLSEGKVKSYKLYNGTAISVKDGFVDFVLDNNGAGDAGSTLQTDSRSAVGRTLRTPMVDILTLFKTHHIRRQDHVVVKVDVEGHEYDLVRRMIVTGLLDRYIDKLAVEWHHNAFWVFGHPGNVTMYPEQFKKHEVYKRRYESIMWILENSAMQKKLHNWG